MDDNAIVPHVTDRLVRTVIDDDDASVDVLAGEHGFHRDVQQRTVVPSQDDHVDRWTLSCLGREGRLHRWEYCTEVGPPAKGGIAGHARRLLRQSGSLLARAELQRRLGLEPAGFDAHHRNVLRHIEGWRYRQDLALLYLLARDVPGDENILEIGSYRGLSTTALALGLRDGRRPGRLHAVDPHTGDRQDLETQGVALIPSEQQFRSNLERAGVADLVTAHVMTSDALAEDWDGSPLRVLFIDGWHSYDAVARDIENWVPRLSGRGAVLIDDVWNYDEVRSAVRDRRAMLPPHRHRTGRMLLAHHGELSADTRRLLRLPWG